jgi:hypothetical protein
MAVDKSHVVKAIPCDPPLETRALPAVAVGSGAGQILLACPENAVLYSASFVFLESAT